MTSNSDATPDLARARLPRAWRLVGVAARDVTEGDRDGQRFQVVLTDTLDGPHTRFAVAPDLAGYSAEQVERVLEARAASYDSARDMAERAPREGAIPLYRDR